MARADGEPITVEPYLALPEDFPALLNEYGELKKAPLSDEFQNYKRSQLFRILSHHGAN
ncbi:hypothetical protein [Methylacidiphilum kamchatkense]|uniref:Uncharacterized protein n=1 Tax=Methylacidiphilum kamchatkense Kam1 TaxID=1202785 RepID=A0A516TJX0_9BACT|nr:hypothetical protein [Methylacidiphilum kamchatkense]QDQ41506.1 hypothetical protein kam1_251 [Methylacidiphilum kamchatkense Kam1]